MPGGFVFSAFIFSGHNILISFHQCLHFHSHPLISYVLVWCNHILGSSRPVFRVGLPPHVFTCSTPVKGTALPTTAGSKPLYCSPFTARRKQYSLCLCRCNDKASVMVAVLWRWETGDDELQMWEMVKVDENSQSASWWGAGGLYDVRVHLKSGLCVWKPVVTPVVGRGGGREMVICCHSYGNVLTVQGLAGQEVRLWLSGL